MERLGRLRLALFHGVALILAPNKHAEYKNDEEEADPALYRKKASSFSSSYSSS
jgi:hypothetical protein